MISAFTVWMEDSGDPTEELESNLTKSERAEMRMIRNPGRAHDFCLSRLMLRRLMREQLPNATATELTRERSGRLVLSGAPGWHISVSHCPGRIAVMLAAAPCGVDIEVFREIAWQKIARRYFSRGEQEWLASLPEANARQAFFQLWTLKEAGVKAMGKGLANHLASLAFDLSGERPQLATTTHGPRLEVHQTTNTSHFLANALVTEQAVSWHFHQLTMSDLRISA